MKKITGTLLCVFCCNAFYAQWDTTLSGIYYTNGKVGIGTTSPAQQLDVNGWIRAQGDGGGNRSHSGGIEFYNNVGASSNVQAQIRALRGIDNWKSGQLAFYTAAPGGTLNERMTIVESGYTGIGIVNPAQQLDVNGWMRVRGDGGSNRENSGGLEFYNNVGASSNVQAQIRAVRGIDNWKSGQLAFYTAAPGGVLNERMTITENGSIGIGTTEPSEKLSVNGNVRARKIMVTQLGWSDYVFEKNYRLRDLNSLEAYIQQYKHLPEVPSAKEVEEKGISVGDNQAILLKKIEELTLYIINQEKRMDSMQQQMNTMEKQIHKNNSFRQTRAGKK